MRKGGHQMTQIRNKNSMFYWWPIVKDLPVPQPKTIMVRHEGAFKGRLSYDPIDGKPDEYFNEMLKGVKKAAQEIGYPVFIRSDGTSNKHDWKDSCYVVSEDQLYEHIVNILERTAMAMGLGFMGIAVREFLELDWRFKSHWGEMPVAREFRMFVREGKLECWHPYWPPSAIQRPTIENWYEVLKEMQVLSLDELEHLTEMAEIIGEAVGGYWSIDLCHAKNGVWYMTDMALGEDSYHWGTCQHAPPHMLEHYGHPDPSSKGDIENE